MSTSLPHRPRTRWAPGSIALGLVMSCFAPAGQAQPLAAPAPGQTPAPAASPAPAAIKPVAPGRLSTTTCWPRFSCSFGWTLRVK